MWTDGNGFFYNGDCRPGDRAATDGEAAGWNASLVPSRMLGFLAFMGLFTATEQAAIEASTDTKVKLLKDEAVSAGVSLSDPSVESGVAYLASANLIATSRVSQILAGQAPPAS